MSSFMCKPETIGAIADYICSSMQFSDRNFLCPPDSLYVRKLNGEPCDRDDIYQRLWNMNAHAVTIGYTDHAVTEAVGEYELYPEMPINDNGGLLLKFDCFLYQCCQGEIPKSGEFDDVLEIRDMLAAIVARRTKEYQEAEWE